MYNLVKVPADKIFKSLKSILYKARIFLPFISTLRRLPLEEGLFTARFPRKESSVFCT